jgi:hypothetical protein
MVVEKGQTLIQVLPKRVRRAVIGTVGAIALSGGSLLFGSASAASASTATSIGVAAATNYGFTCDARNNWVHQNWPNISIRSAKLQLVYVRSFLYRWNGKAWVLWHTAATAGAPQGYSIWYEGVSDVHGRHQLGNSYQRPGTPWVGYLPYYFAIAGHPSLQAPNDGYAFTHLPDGYYTTVEQYYAIGKYWNSQSHYQSTANNYKSPTYCRI